MPTSYWDQFFIIDPFFPPPPGTQLDVQFYELVDNNDDGDVDRFNNDRVNGQDVTQSYPGDVVTVNVPGVGNVTYTGITFYLANGVQVFTPTDGQRLQSGELVSASGVTTQGPLPVGNLGPVCFTPGTPIEVPGGRRAVEALGPGDMVLTLDHGPQPVRHVARGRFRAGGTAAPVRIAKGALGNDAEFEVSQQHRLLLTGWRAELLFGEDEVLVPAIHLVDGRGIRLRTEGAVEYIHLVFDRHEIVTAAGLPSESCFPGPALMAQSDRCAQAELAALFPSLRARSGAAPLPAARRVLRAHEARLMAA